jgi:hypothetical protein
MQRQAAYLAGRAAGIELACSYCMFTSARTAAGLLLCPLCLMACDDTGKAIKEEVQEIDKQEVKRDLKEGAAAVGSAAEKAGRKVDEAAPKVVEGVKNAVDEAGKAIDKVDKKAAEEIRK